MSATSHQTEPRLANRSGTPDGLSGIDRLENGGFSRLCAAHCDGALKHPGQLHSGLGFAGPIESLARQALHGTPQQAASLSQSRRAELLQQAEENPAAIPATAAQLWLQPVGARKLALQWNVPSNIRRNCRDLLGGEQADFVLRLYQQLPVSNGWKASHRTLEFTVDLSRRRCFIKLEHTGGLYSAELGVKLGDDRYVFLARSGESTLPSPAPLPNSKVEYAGLQPQNLTFPACPSSFRHADVLEESAATEVFETTDHDARDCRAEARVRATYLDFCNEGPRVFRSRGKIAPLPKEERKKDHQRRQESAHQKAERLKAQKQVQEAEARAARFAFARVDARNRSEATAAPVAAAPAPALQHPPVLVAQTGYDPRRLTRAQALRHAALPVLCQKENLIPVETRPASAATAPEKAGARRRVIHVKSAGGLAELLRNTQIDERAEIILKGRVKPGRRVRVGGLLIETAEDGSFCVACMIRNGKLFVPVEEVQAVTVE